MDARRSSTAGTSVRLRQITGVENSDDGQDLSPIDESNIQNQNARSSNRGMSVGIQQMMGLEESGSRNNSDDPSLTNNINRHHRSSATAMSLRLQQIMGLEGVGSSSVGEDSSHGKNRNRHRRTSTLGSNLAMSARLQQIMGLEGLGNSSFGEDPGVKESNHEAQDEAAVDVDANPDVEEICVHDEHTTTTSNDEKKPNTQETGVEEIKDRWDKHRFYDWRKFMRKMDVVAFLRWLRDGETSPDTVEQTDVEIYTNLWCLARLVRLLRIYHQKYGVPKLGGAKDQEFVLREVTRDLYAGGCPVWVISPVMQRVAEGLTGKRGVEFFMLPRQAFIFAPSSGATILFKIGFGFNIQLVTLMERIVVRLASFASNARSVISLPTREPTPRELGNALKLERDTVSEEDLSKIPRDELVKQILDLGSESEGLFFFINTRGLKKNASSPPAPHPSQQKTPQDDVENGNLGYNSQEAEAVPTIDPQGSSSDSKKSHLSEIFKNLKQKVPSPKTVITPDPWEEVDPFWLIEEEISEVFSRLACQEALVSIENADKIVRPLYSFIPWRAFFLFGSSAGAALYWFSGTWTDGLVAGLMRLLVNFISGWSIFTKEERLLLEVVASFFVGAGAGFISITWPDSTCSDAIAICGVFSVLQTFKVVFAVIELLSRQTVIGTANLFEAVLFTALVSFTLVGGQEVASLVLGRPADDLYLLCNHPINENWYFLLVPIGSICWSALFNPMYEDLPLMAFHGTLAYAVSWSINVNNLYDGFSLFLSAAIVSLSAGLTSRFTGRSAMGNTLAGLSALIPGAFLVRLFQVNAADSLVLLGEALVRCGLVGLGAWTGTLLCSPVILGVSAAQAQRHAFQSNRPKPGSSVREKHVRVRGTGPVLFF